MPRCSSNSSTRPAIRPTSPGWTDSKWRLEPHVQLFWRRLDDEWVVFDSWSGDTHHLDGISAAALMCLEAEPLDLDGLIGVLASELDLQDREGLAGKLENLLGQLNRLGLIEPVES